MIDRNDPKVQKWIKYGAIALAVCLAIGILGGIVAAIGSVFGLFFSDATLDEIKTYEISDDISHLEIEISAADFSIEYGDTFCIKSNLSHLEVRENGKTLDVEDENKFSANYNDAVFVLIIPEGKSFESAEITTGAGRVYIAGLALGELELTLGAGEATIDALTATHSAKIEGGAGEITVKNSSLANLDFDMGVGKVTMTGALVGRCELNVGVGEFNLNLLGGDDIYSLELNKGIGSIKVDGKDVDGGITLGMGENKIILNGGIGAVNVTYSE